MHVNELSKNSHKEISMIPKIIHYIWFGPNPYPEKVRCCIESWHKYLPNYEFKLWNEETFDINNSCDFVIQAYERKKYAFVSDYVRLWALKNFGGIYLDTDIEILRPLDSEFLNKQVVLGTDNGGYLTALMMSVPNHVYINECLDEYHSQQFVLQDGKLNMEVNNTSLQNHLKRFGYQVNNMYQSLKDGIVVYPDDYFHVRSLQSGKLNITANSYAIHWHTITWVSSKTRIINWVRIHILVPLLGSKLYTKLTKKIK